jgi:glucose-1-phosphate thymidylyltransferase
MVKKGIILAAGKGTRLYPATIAIGKPLLPIFDKPMIYYSLAILMKARIREVCIVTNRHDISLFRELLSDGSHLGMHIQYRIQDIPKGIADVFNVAEDFIHHEECALVLGDNIFMGEQWDSRLHDLQNQNVSGAKVFAYPVEDPNRYGVLKLNHHQEVIDVIEKPIHAPSNLAITGLYFYDEKATSFAKSLKPSARGELEITDLNRLYLQQKQLTWIKLDAPDDEWFDVGTHEAMYHAIDKVSTYVICSKKQIACIEEIAFQNGWIDLQKLKSLQQRVKTTAYGKYLEKYF